MDELDMFTSLRPTEPALDEAERDLLRSRIFGPGSTDVASEPAVFADLPGRPFDGLELDLDATGPAGHGNPRPRRSPGGRPRRRLRTQRAMLVATSALVGLCVGGIVAIRSGSSPTGSEGQGVSSASSPSPASTLPSTVPVPGASPTDVPRVVFDQPGWTLTYASEFGNSAAGPIEFAEYQYKNVDGRSLQLRFYRGADALATRIGGETRTALDVRDEEFSLLDEGGRRFRVNVQRGAWAWEIDFDGFASADELADLIGTMRVVDETTWRAVLPSNITSPDGRSAAIAELLVGVPLPPGFDVAELVDRGLTKERYQLIAEVSGAVACGWLGQWFDGQEQGDAGLQASAAAALATSREWPMLLEIDDQGGWSEVLWMHADAVNGGDGVMTGAGPMPPTRSEAESALGCQFG